jgi:hypothetical protein
MTAMRGIIGLGFYHLVAAKVLTIRVYVSFLLAAFC